MDLKRRGLSMGPELVVADGAFGFWQAMEDVWPKTRAAGCTKPPTCSTSCRRATRQIKDMSARKLNPHTRLRAARSSVCMVRPSRAPDRPDQAFSIAVLPGQAERGGPVPDAHCSHPSLERAAKCSLGLLEPSSKAFDENLMKAKAGATLFSARSPPGDEDAG